jgi:uncharacterized protein (TIGR02001 family)
MSDYLYRGISLSDRGPSVSSLVEVRRSWFYVSGQFYTVRLPTDPAAELTLTGGIRREFAGIEFDLSAEYYCYPGETPAPGSGTTNYWQSGLRASRRIFDAFEIVGHPTYAPNSWNSGAWGAYGAGEIKKFKLGNRNEVTWTLGAEFAHQSFGTTSQGSALPSYAHWRLGAAFKYDVVSFDLSYHDTNLSKEDCFVLAGSSATPGVGRFGDNPGGLQSNLCGRALVATVRIQAAPVVAASSVIPGRASSREPGIQAVVRWLTVWIPGSAGGGAGMPQQTMRPYARSFSLTVSTRPPAFFQASRPPSMWQAGRPASCAARTAIAERSPKAQ